MMLVDKSYPFLWHCLSRHLYYCPAVLWPFGIAGCYVVDDFGNLVKVES